MTHRLRKEWGRSRIESYEFACVGEEALGGPTGPAESATYDVVYERRYSHFVEDFVKRRDETIIATFSACQTYSLVVGSYEKLPKSIIRHPKQGSPVQLGRCVRGDAVYPVPSELPPHVNRQQGTPVRERLPHQFPK